MTGFLIGETDNRQCEGYADEYLMYPVTTDCAERISVIERRKSGPCFAILGAIALKKFNPPFPIEARFPPVSEEMLMEVSKSLARPLPFPEDYLDFLRQWNGVISLENGGMVQYLNAAEMCDDDLDEGYASISSLFGIGDSSDFFDLRKCQKHYSFDRRVPGHFLAIGVGISVDFVCMSLAHETYGLIMIWEPGESWPEDGKYIQTMDALRPLANSFGEFWDRLQRETRR